MSNTTTTSRCKFQRFHVSLGPFARDERLAFVDHVCAVLAESRFGPGSFYKPISGVEDAYVTPTLTGSITPDEIFDLTEQLRMHAQTIQPVELRKANRIETSSAISKHSSRSVIPAGRFAYVIPSISRPLARGSPRPVS